MPNRFARGHRDANEPQFVSLLRVASIRYNLAPEGHGCDLYVFLPGGVDLWEIKNPEQKPSDRQLTQAEIEMQAECLEFGIPYFVFEYVEQAAQRIEQVRGEVCLFGGGHEWITETNGEYTKTVCRKCRNRRRYWK